MKNKKKHLSYEERFFIEKMLFLGNNLTLISEALGRGLSTISQEVKENGGKRRYKALYAQNRSNTKQHLKKKYSKKLLNNKKLRGFVDRRLKKGLSAEAMSKLLRNQSGLEYASGKSIRNYIKWKLR